MSARRTDAVVEEAVAKSKALLQAVPTERRQHLQAVHVIDVCRRLVDGRPASEPTTARVAEEGARLYPRFPAAQTIHNSYRRFRQVWHEAYWKLIDVSAPAPKPGDLSLPFDMNALPGLDHGTRARLEILVATEREQRKQLIRLKTFIEERIPVSREEGGDTLDLAQQATVRKWLADFTAPGGKLISSPEGLSISRKARPQDVVVPADVLDVLTRLTGGPPQTVEGELERPIAANFLSA